MLLRCVATLVNHVPCTHESCSTHSFCHWGFDFASATSARFHPMQVAVWFHNFVASTRIFSCPAQRATWLRERLSAGLDWLGTRSSQTWHEWVSSKRKKCLSTLLLGSLPDQVLRKLPLTDSLSVKATIRRPAWPGHHTDTAINKANISNSWIIVCWSVLMAARMKDLLISSLKNPNTVPSLE